MPIKSRWSIPISEASLPTWVFGSPDQPLENGDKRALTDADRPDTHYLTLSQYRLWAKRVAVGLQRAGLQTGDRVLLFSGNNLFFPVMFMGIIMAGGIFTGANPTYVARELAYQLKDSGAKFLVCADGSLEVGLEAAKINGMSKDKIFIFDDAALDGTGKDRLGVKNWNNLIASTAEGERFRWKDARSSKETTVCLNYSSGTTGVPKGVELTHYNYVANCSQVIALIEMRDDHEQRLKEERWLCLLPMYHAYGKLLFQSLPFKAPFEIIPLTPPRPNLLHNHRPQTRRPNLHHAALRLPKNALPRPTLPHHHPNPRAPHRRRARQTPRRKILRPVVRPQRRLRRGTAC
jgi:4-coumarate--CoA ligase